MVSHRGKPAARSSSLSFFFLFVPAMQLYTNQLSLEAILSPTTLELILPLSPYKPPVNQSNSQVQKVKEGQAKLHPFSYLYSVDSSHLILVP